jgi:hypothetical protein
MTSSRLFQHLKDFGISGQSSSLKASSYKGYNLSIHVLASRLATFFGISLPIHAYFSVSIWYQLPLAFYVHACSHQETGCQFIQPILTYLISKVVLVA